VTDPLGPQKERPWWNPSRAEEANKPGPFSPGRQGWLQNRRRKVIEEIERNRRGDYAVPTWVLFVILVAVVAALVALFTFF
jgi:hypothetical protein